MRHLDCYTDASVCLGRSLVCSAFVVKDQSNDSDKVIHSSSIIYSGRCNNHGEMRAILECLLWLDGQDLRDTSVCIKSDSKDSIQSIDYGKQGICFSIRMSYLKLKSKLNGRIKLVHVQRSQVHSAHCLSRRELKKEIERLEGGPSSGEKRKMIDKQIERQWLLSKWLEVCK